MEHSNTMHNDETLSHRLPVHYVFDYNSGTCIVGLVSSSILETHTLQRGKHLLSTFKKRVTASSKFCLGKKLYKNKNSLL
jgi:hypothetical protein